MEQQTGLLLAASNLIARCHELFSDSLLDWSQVTAQFLSIIGTSSALYHSSSVLAAQNLIYRVMFVEPMLSDNGKAPIALQTLALISRSAPLYIDYGSEEDPDGGLNAYSLIKLLSDKVKSAKLDSKVVPPPLTLSLAQISIGYIIALINDYPQARERYAQCTGCTGLSDPDFPWRRLCVDNLMNASTTKVNTPLCTCNLH